MNLLTSSDRRFDLARLRGANNEGILALVLLALIVVMTIVSPSFFSVGTFFSIVRSSIVPLVFALGVLIVIISGGVDVSFAAIAIFAAYTTVNIAQTGGFDPGLIAVIVIACAVGGLLGLVNGAVIARFRLPTLIVTLGTQGIFRGVLLAYIGSRYIADLPGSMASLVHGEHHRRSTKEETPRSCTLSSYRPSCSAFSSRGC